MWTRRQFLRKSLDFTVKTSLCGSAVAYVGSRAIRSVFGAQSPSSDFGSDLELLQTRILPQDGTVDLNPAPAGYNLNFRNLTPAVAVQCATPQAVVRALEWARETKTPLRMRSGGHSYEGYSTGSGLLIDLSPMNQITVDATEPAALIGAGARLGQVAEALWPHGYALPSGTCPDVGISGLVLGGGYGMLSRKYGLTLDNLLALQIVLADGRILRASETENSDLFWACRGGGGGNFGVVTHFYFRLRPVENVLVYSLQWPNAGAAQAFERWQSIATELPDELTCNFQLEGSRGQVLLPIASGLFLGTDENRLKELLSPLLGLNQPVFKCVEKTYIEAVHYLGGNNWALPIRFKAKSDYVREPLDAQGIQAMLRALQSVQSGAVSMMFDAYGGAINRVPTSATAFCHREGTRYSIQYYTQWSNASDTPARLQMMRDLYAQMRPYVSGEAYVNYCDSDLKDWGRAYYGRGFERLVRIKSKYDPENVFNFAQSIPLTLPVRV